MTDEVGKKKKRKPTIKSKKTSVRIRPFEHRLLTLIFPTLLFICGIGILLWPKPKYAMSRVSAHIYNLFQEVEPHPIGDRIAFWSAHILEDPELLTALGSGPEINDTVPLFNATYDCTTYVETVGALARSQSDKDLAEKLVSIRYRNGLISYETRNHFPEADWIPNNESSGNLTDITLQISRKAGFTASFVNKDIDKVAWFSSRTVASVKESESIVTVKLAYIPLKKIQMSLTHIPQGAVINIVHVDQDRYPVLISHQGFLIWKNGMPYFRHASRNRRIAEIPFAD